jgi:protein SCO1/2
MLCTMVLNDLTRSMNSLSENAGQQFDVLAVSFDPAETPDLAAAKKRQYIQAYRRPGADEGWHFLTGAQESISRLTAAVGFRYAWDARNQQWAHTNGLAAGDRRSRREEGDAAAEHANPSLLLPL